MANALSTAPDGFRGDFLTDARVCAARADRIRSRFPSTSKNTAGYALNEYLRTRDVLDLVIGSEGTLGFVTRAELALDERPAASGVILVAIDDLAALGDAVGAMRTHEPVAIELVEGTLLRLGADRVPDRLRDVEATLLASFEGPDEEAVRHVMDEEIRTLPAKYRFAETAVTPADRAALWRIRKAASPTLAALPDSRRSLQFIEDGCVPVEALGEYVLGVREAATTAGIDIVAFGHAGDEHLHVNALVDTAQPDFPQKLVQLFDRVTELVIRLGGTPTGEHGDGRLRASLTERLYGHELTMLFRAVKTAFDPKGIFNPGVILAEGMPDPGKSLEGRAEGSNDSARCCQGPSPCRADGRLGAIED